jgi:hypothetical protein
MNRRTLQVVTLVAVLSVVSPCLVHAQGNWQPGDFGSVRFRLGLFQPRADSEYWDQKFTDFTGSASSFENIVFGVEYLWMTSRDGGIAFGGSFYEGSATQAYRDYVDLEGRDIRHTTTLGLTDLTATYIHRLARGGIRPYLGIGGGLVWWRLQEEGSFIDFSSFDAPIVFASYRADGTTWEALGLLGVEVPIAFKWRFFVEGRYRWAEAELNRDFSGFGTIDLSGYELTGGFSINW